MSVANVRQMLRNTITTYREHAERLQTQARETSGVGRHIIGAAAHEALLAAGVLDRQLTDLDAESDRNQLQLQLQGHRWRRVRVTYAAKRRAIHMAAVSQTATAAPPAAPTTSARSTRA